MTTRSFRKRNVGIGESNEIAIFASFWEVRQTEKATRLIGIGRLSTILVRVRYGRIVSVLITSGPISINMC